jgi:hypothetical protein
MQLLGFLCITFPGLALVCSYVLCVDRLLLPSAKFPSMFSIDRLFRAACIVMESISCLLLSVKFVLVFFIDVIFAIL